MAQWDPVPWSVGGGAEHSPDLLRLLAYALSLDEGVVGGSNAKVTALTVPAGQVNISPGAAVLLNRYLGTTGGQQAYVGRLGSTDTVAISPTAGSARSDLVVVRVKDPQYEGAAPANPNAFQYIYTTVIPGVPAGTTSAAQLNLGYPAIALARIDIPASTGAITNAMITDLRELVRGRSERQRYVIYPVSADQVDPTATAAVPDAWPNVATRNIKVPAWATKASLRADIAGAYGYNDPAGGGFRVVFSDQPTQNSTWSHTAPNAANSPRFNLLAGGDVTISSAIRGTTQALYTQAFINSGGSTPGSLRVDGGSTVILEIEFKETPT